LAVPACKRILFVSEAITLAQMVRLVMLARALPRDRYEVHFASSQFPGFVFDGLDVRRWPLWGLSPDKAMARVASGKRLYSRRVLRRSIEADRQVIQAIKPDLVIGDLRWSLAVSAPMCGVPLVSLINAYWSPFANRSGFPMPEHPMVRILGEKFAAKYFPCALPWVFAHFAAPLNTERRRAGLPEIGSLLEVLTFGDHVLYADPPELVSTAGLPNHHHFLGPIVWSAPGDLPADWGTRAGRPPVYVTLGSSGATGCLPVLLEALAAMPVDTLLATAGRELRQRLPANVRAIPFVDGAAACARARVVIHNGGSSTGYQALAAGTPVLGLPGNLDQYLASERIDQRGAGLSLRSGTLTARQVTANVQRLLDEPAFTKAAASLADVFKKHDAAANFRAFVDGRWARPSIREAESVGIEGIVAGVADVDRDLRHGARPAVRQGA
jgi:UDP:flavonoid glycosyltransferase YjiC (YdhE family)